MKKKFPVDFFLQVKMDPSFPSKTSGIPENYRVVDNRSFSGWEIALLIIIALVVLFLFGYLAWYFLYRNRGVPTGGKCTQDSDCQAGNYCGGSVGTMGQCVQGTSGGTEGAVCKVNADCEVGLSCLDSKCSSGKIIPLSTPTTSAFLGSGTNVVIVNSSGTTSGSTSTSGALGGSSVTETNIGSFSNQLITVTVRDSNNSTSQKYLNVTETGSDWISEPRSIFTYNSGNRTLSVINSSTTPILSRQVYISPRSGQLVVNPNGSSSCGGGSVIRIVQVSDGTSTGLYMKDPAGNNLSVGLGDCYPVAFFNDPNIYTSIPMPPPVSRPVRFQLQPAPLLISSTTGNQIRIF